MPSKGAILIVLEDANLQHTLHLILRKAGHYPAVANHVHEVWRCLETCRFDLIIIDSNTAVLETHRFLQRIHQAYPGLPVLVLTSDVPYHSVSIFLESGARDFISKPFDPAQLIRRVEMILGEEQIPVVSQPPKQRLWRIREAGFKTPFWDPYNADDPSRFFRRGPFQVDLHACQATLGTRFLPLSPIAFRYLVVLLRHAPDAVTSYQLVHEAQGLEIPDDQLGGVARRWISKLRSVIEPDPRQPHYILTVRGSGYRLSVQ